MELWGLLGPEDRASVQLLAEMLWAGWWCWEEGQGSLSPMSPLSHNLESAEHPRVKVGRGRTS